MPPTTPVDYQEDPDGTRWYRCQGCGFFCGSFPGDTCDSCYRRAAQQRAEAGTIWNPQQGGRRVEDLRGVR